MKRTIVISLCLLMLVSCGGAKGGATLEELQKSNEDLTRRVKSLEDEVLEANKKIIQHQQALQTMHEQLRDMENSVSKFQMRPSR